YPRNPAPAYITRPSAAAKTGSPALPEKAMPLLRTSSKPAATAPDAGQPQLMSSSSLVTAGAGGVAAPPEAAVVVVAGAGDLPSSGRVSTLEVVSGRVVAAFGSRPGGITRKT